MHTRISLNLHICMYLQGWISVHRRQRRSHYACTGMRHSVCARVWYVCAYDVREEKALSSHLHSYAPCHAWMHVCAPMTLVYS